MSKAAKLNQRELNTSSDSNSSPLSFIKTKIHREWRKKGPWWFPEENTTIALRYLLCYGLNFKTYRCGERHTEWHHTGCVYLACSTIMRTRILSFGRRYSFDSHELCHVKWDRNNIHPHDWIFEEIECRVLDDKVPNLLYSISVALSCVALRNGWIHSELWVPPKHGYAFGFSEPKFKSTE